jgi:hypothetical protein
MAIIGALPSALTNGTTADATQVMADFNFLVNQINANAAPVGALTAPSGTRTVFHQAAAPAGWVIDTSVTDHGLQVAAASGGGKTSSATAYSSFLSGNWSTSGHALTAAEIPAHTHNLTITTITSSGSTTGLAVGGILGSVPVTTDGGTGGGAAHTHANGTTWNYIACVVAQKS